MQIYCLSKKLILITRAERLYFIEVGSSQIELNLNAEGILLHLVKNNVVKGSTDTTNYSIKKESINIISS